MDFSRGDSLIGILSQMAGAKADIVPAVAVAFYVAAMGARIAAGTELVDGSGIEPTVRYQEVTAHKTPTKAIPRPAQAIGDNPATWVSTDP